MITFTAGLSVQDIAARHGVAVSTVRAQLSTVLGKVGVSRQAEVAAALAPMALLALAG